MVTPDGNPCDAGSRPAETVSAGPPPQPRDEASFRVAKGGWRMARPQKTKKEKLGVKIVVEITGHMQRAEVNQFMASLSSVVNNHVENGGNGGS